GRELAPGESHCAACDRSSSTQPGSASASGYLSYHLRILSVLWLLYAIYRIIVGVWQMAFAPTATLMFGALLQRVPDPFAMMAHFHIAYTAMVIFTFLGAFFALLAACLLFVRQRSGRAIAIVAAFLALPEIPLGLALGVYTLVIALSFNASRLYPSVSPSLAAASDSSAPARTPTAAARI
ncbi:MAG: hypothetical protein WA660_07735, partial [Candidatus Acidiferrales bacterium]